VTSPLELAFELGVPDAGGVTQWLPLQVGGPDAAGGHTGPLARYAFAPTAQVLDDGTPVTATLVPNRERGLHLELYASAAATAALSALAEPTDCELRAHVDAAGAVAEHEEEDNWRSVWVRFFPGGFEHDEPTGGDAPPAGEPDPSPDGGLTASAPRPMTPASGVDLENVLDRQSRSDGAGNGEFAMGYWFSTALTYATNDPTRIVAGDRIALYDWAGRAVQLAMPATSPTAFRLEAAPGGGYRMLIANTNPRFPGVLTACREAGWTSVEPYGLSPTLASRATSPGCTAFRFVDADGGELESGDHVRWLAPNGNLVSPGTARYVAAPGTPADARSLFTIRRVGGDSSAARGLRLVARGSTSLKVFGHDHTPLGLATTASLDVDVPENNRFLCVVDVFDVTMLDLDPMVATEESGTITIYSADRDLYSREKKETRKFLLAGFIPVEVTASATGTLGLHGEVTAGPDRRLTLGIGPFVDLVGAANAEVNIEVADAGVHMDLRFLKLTEVFENSLVLTSGGEKRYEFGGELRLESLDGHRAAVARPARTLCMARSACRLGTTCTLSAGPRRSPQPRVPASRRRAPTGSGGDRRARDEEAGSVRPGLAPNLDGGGEGPGCRLRETTRVDQESRHGDDGVAGGRERARRRRAPAPVARGRLVREGRLRREADAVGPPPAARAGAGGLLEPGRVRGPGAARGGLLLPRDDHEEGRLARGVPRGGSRRGAGLRAGRSPQGGTRVPPRVRARS
jgi:hypothetical protein